MLLSKVQSLDRSIFLLFYFIVFIVLGSNTTFISLLQHREQS
nr:MAG TPA: hypothetical protein [Caudoviricetes sp.]